MAYVKEKAKDMKKMNLKKEKIEDFKKFTQLDRRMIAAYKSRGLSERSVIKKGWSDFFEHKNN